jgi:hypothetical protein
MPSPRDRHIQTVQEKGRCNWQRAVGYGKRSLVETAMFRYQTLIGPTLRARTLPAQKTEARIACAVINRMTERGRPISQRVRSRNEASPQFVPHLDLCTNARLKLFLHRYNLDRA